MPKTKLATGYESESRQKKVEIQDINLNLIKALDALLKEKNVSKAAKLLGLSQPATSHALNKLRKVFNDPVLVKTAHGMEPTQLSLRIQDEVHSIIKKVDLLVNKTINFNPIDSKQQFTIGVIEFADFLIMPEMVNWIIKNNSNISIRTVSLASTNIFEMLRRNEIDLAITHMTKKQAEFVQQELSEIGTVGLMAKNHPLADKKVTMQNYVKYPQIAIKTWLESYPEFDESLAEYGLSRDIKFIVTSPLLIPELLPSTELISTVPALLAEQWVSRNKNIIMKSLPFKGVMPKIHQIWHKRFDHDPAHKWLREKVYTCFKKAYKEI